MAYVATVYSPWGVVTPGHAFRGWTRSALTDGKAARVYGAPVFASEDISAAYDTAEKITAFFAETYGAASDDGHRSLPYAPTVDAPPSASSK